MTSSKIEKPSSSLSVLNVRQDPLGSSVLLKCSIKNHLPGFRYLVKAKGKNFKPVAQAQSSSPPKNRKKKKKKKNRKNSNETVSSVRVDKEERELPSEYNLPTVKEFSSILCPENSKIESFSFEQIVSVDHVSNGDQSTFQIIAVPPLEKQYQTEEDIQRKEALRKEISELEREKKDFSVLEKDPNFSFQPTQQAFPVTLKATKHAIRKGERIFINLPNINEKIPVIVPETIEPGCELKFTVTQQEVCNQKVRLPDGTALSLPRNDMDTSSLRRFIHLEVLRRQIKSRKDNIQKRIDEVNEVEKRRKIPFLCSNILEVMVPASVPMKLNPPTPASRKKSSIKLKWRPPLDDNGSPVHSYRMQMKVNENEEHQWFDVYTGKDLHCTITNLIGGKCYCFRVSAINEIGQSDFSDVTKVKTLAGLPEPPEQVSIIQSTSIDYGVCTKIVDSGGDSVDNQVEGSSKDDTDDISDGDTDDSDTDDAYHNSNEQGVNTVPVKPQSGNNNVPVKPHSGNNNVPVIPHSGNSISHPAQPSGDGSNVFSGPACDLTDFFNDPTYGWEDYGDCNIHGKRRLEDKVLLAEGASCTPTCSKGYMISGKVFCAQGIVGPSFCKPSSCIPEKPLHGSLGDCKHYYSYMEHGTKCKPNCDKGYILKSYSYCKGGRFYSGKCEPPPCCITNNDMLPNTSIDRTGCPDLLKSGQRCQFDCMSASEGEQSFYKHGYTKCKNGLLISVSKCCSGGILPADCVNDYKKEEKKILEKNRLMNTVGKGCPYNINQPVLQDPFENGGSSNSSNSNSVNSNSGISNSGNSNSVNGGKLGDGEDSGDDSNSISSTDKGKTGSSMRISQNQNRSRGSGNRSNRIGAKNNVGKTSRASTKRYNDGEDEGRGPMGLIAVVAPTVVVFVGAMFCFIRWRLQKKGSLDTGEVVEEENGDDGSGAVERKNPLTDKDLSDFPALRRDTFLEKDEEDGNEGEKGGGETQS
eukprot:g5970.t1